MLSKAQILDHVWRYDFGGDSGVVETYISYLRKKIDRGDDVALIQTVRGFGYAIRRPRECIPFSGAAPSREAAEHPGGMPPSDFTGDSWDANRLEALISNVPGAIYRCSPASDWAMGFISDEIEVISGYPAAEFVRLERAEFASVIHPDDRRMVEQHVGRHSTGASPSSSSTGWCTPTGRFAGCTSAGAGFSTRAGTCGSSTGRSST